MQRLFTYVTAIVETSDLYSLLLMIVIPWAVGQRMVQSRPSMRLWGVRTAAGTFFVFTVMRSIQNGVPGTAELKSGLLLGLLAAALLLGPAWIVLSIFGFPC